MTLPPPRNLFADLPASRAREAFEALLETPHLRLERIVSFGQATPAGEWYEQDADEWVALLQGGAGLLCEGEAEPRVLAPGDWVLIPAHTRHRVAWTAPDGPTVWLALHVPPER
jgi:cupin 2 domain-containing protein